MLLLKLATPIRSKVSGVKAPVVQKQANIGGSFSKILKSLLKGQPDPQGKATANSITAKITPLAKGTAEAQREEQRNTSTSGTVKELKSQQIPFPIKHLEITSPSKETVPTAKSKTFKATEKSRTVTASIEKQKPTFTYQTAAETKNIKDSKERKPSSSANFVITPHHEKNKAGKQLNSKEKPTEIGQLNIGLPIPSAEEEKSLQIPPTAPPQIKVPSRKVETPKATLNVDTETKTQVGTPSLNLNTEKRMGKEKHPLIVKAEALPEKTAATAQKVKNHKPAKSRKTKTLETTSSSNRTKKLKALISPFFKISQNDEIAETPLMLNREVSIHHKTEQTAGSQINTINQTFSKPLQQEQALSDGNSSGQNRESNNPKNHGTDILPKDRTFNFEFNTKDFSIKALMNTRFLTMNLNFSSDIFADPKLLKEIEAIVSSVFPSGKVSLKVKGKTIYSSRFKREEEALSLRV